MRVRILAIALFLTPFFRVEAQSGQFIKDKQKGCLVWVPNFNPADSLTITWDGPCKNKMAEGVGTMRWYIKNNQVSEYTGEIKKGSQNGQGRFNFPGGFVQEGHFIDGIMNGQGRIIFPDSTKKIEGNFYDGEILNLDPEYLSHLTRNVITGIDSTDMYVNDRGKKELLYYVLVPSQPVKAVLVLLPGTWDRTEYVLSNNKKLVQLAFDNHIAVLVPSVNQRLTLNTDVLNFLNNCFSGAIEKYQLPEKKFILGGFSMGGLFSLRYTEMAYQDPVKTRVKPIAVYSVDGPVDMENLYKAELRALESSPNKAEANYALDEFKKNMGGVPDSVRKNYVYYSSYSFGEKDGGNAKYIVSVPLRIYNDVDVNWWLTNRNADLYDMNALDQSAMINFLQKNGNKNAEFINALGKGYRLDGTRHPHSWSIVDPEECLQWMKRWIE